MENLSYQVQELWEEASRQCDIKDAKKEINKTYFKTLHKS